MLSSKPSMSSASIVNRRRFLLLFFAGTALLIILLLFTPSSLLSPHREALSKWTGIDKLNHQHSTPNEVPAVALNTSHNEAWNQTRYADTTKSGWRFIPERDQRDYGLSREQCEVAFPKFYHEITRSLKYWRDHGPIQKKHVDISWQKESGMLRLLIFDQQLYVIERVWTSPDFDIPRGLAVLHSINRALLTSTAVPNIEFTINVSDWPKDPDNIHPTWVFSRRDKDTSKWLMPDFGYWSWPLGVMGEYTQIRSEIQQIEPSWEKKQKKAVWRGATATNPLRDRLMEVSQGKKWSDIKAITWKNDQPVVGDGKEDPMSIPEHCNYRYVVHTEGHSYSGRTKYLLNCHSVSIMHQQEWIEPQSHLYISSGPEQNVVLVEKNFSDLDQKMQQLLNNDTESLRIANNSASTFRDRYLTPAAQTCYWRRMFSAWASLTNFEPELYEQKGRFWAKKKWKLRGIPFESFVADPVAIRG